MKKEEKINPIQGRRLKECLKNVRLTQRALSTMTSYTVQHINNIANSKRSMTREAAHIFSSILHVDEDYLLGISDYKNSDEMRAYLDNIGRTNMHRVLDYLETLGLTFKPSNSLFCTVTAIYRNIDTLAHYINPKSLELLKQQYDFTLNSEIFLKKYLGRHVIVELTSSLPNMPFLRKEDLTKGDKVLPPADSDVFFDEYLVDQDFLKENAEVTISFNVYYKGESIKQISENELHAFIKKLDAFSLCTIENVLFT